MTGRPDFRTMTATAAARRLDVGVELVNGLASQRKIRAVQSTGRSGVPVWLVSKDDIERLREQMR